MLYKIYTAPTIKGPGSSKQSSRPRIILTEKAKYNPNMVIPKNASTTITADREVKNDKNFSIIPPT